MFIWGKICYNFPANFKAEMSN